MAAESINSLVQNLTISALPSDGLNVVVAKAKDYELTDRLKQLLAEANPDISQKASPEDCASAISSSVPKYFLEQIVDLLTRNLQGCYTESNDLVTVAKGYIADTSSNFVDVSRLFWKQWDKAVEELTQKENEVNQNSAAVRAICMPTSSDCQSTADDALLAITLDNINPGYLDDAFQTANELYVEPQPDAATIVKEVLKDNPQTVGVSGSIPPTNLIDYGNGETIENIETVDLAPGGLVDDARNGILGLFSNKLLNTPLNRIKELGGNPAQIDYFDFTSITFMTTANGQAPTEVTDLKPQTITVYSEILAPTTGLDFNKTVLDQDWTVSSTQDASDVLAAHNIEHYVVANRPIINPIELIKSINQPTLVKLRTANLKFKGVMTRRVYKIDDVLALGSGLAGLWGKLKNIKLPSPAQLQMGSNLLAAGLGAVGQITGSAGLVKASDVMGVISNGLGVFVQDPLSPASYKPRANTEDSTKGCIYRHSNSIVPNLIQAGYEQMGKSIMSAQRLRQELNNENRAVVQAYLPSGVPPKLSAVIQLRRRRTNKLSR